MCSIRPRSNNRRATHPRAAVSRSLTKVPIRMIIMRLAAAGLLAMVAVSALAQAPSMDAATGVRGAHAIQIIDAALVN
jgi:hypothetical protein